MNSCACLRVKTSLEPNVIPPAPTCNPIIDDYRLKRDSNLNISYEKVGEHNVDEYINSFKDSCSLQSLLSRCSLMTPEAKINYLQQTSDGFSADLSNLPKDGTEAFIMLQKLKTEYPDVVDRFSKGDSLETILNDIVTDSNNTNIENKGDINNGEE